MLLKQEQVIYNNGHKFQAGYISNCFENSGVEYVEVRFSGGKSVVTMPHCVYPMKFFLSKVKDAEFEICHYCRGSGRIDPIENPPYKCDSCNGEGFYVRVP
uniref:Uncharacterized protein n=1 Tax=viral metagenome TaxID=1070528 RepID=A0A6M3KY26_9ZZZZ